MLAWLHLSYIKNFDFTLLLFGIYLPAMENRKELHYQHVQFEQRMSVDKLFQLLILFRITRLSVNNISPLIVIYLYFSNINKLFVYVTIATFEAKGHFSIPK